MHGIKTLFVLCALLIIGIGISCSLFSKDARSFLSHKTFILIPIVAIAIIFKDIWIYYGVIFLSMVFLPKNKAEAVGLYIFLALLLPLVSYDAVIGSINVLRLTGHMVAATGLIFAFRFSENKSNYESKSEHGIVLCTIAFMILQFIISARIDGANTTVVARSMMTTVFTVGIPFFILSSTPDRSGTLVKGIIYIVHAGIILSFLAMFEMFRHWPMYQTVESSLGTFSGVSRTLALRGGLLRAAGPFFESTTFGLFLALAGTCTIAMRNIFNSKPAHAFAIMINVIGCFATLSRNAWIGMAIGAIGVSVYRGSFGKAISITTVLMGIGSVLALASPNSGVVASLLGKANTGAAGTITYRSDLIPASIPLIIKSPIIGTPYDEVKDSLRSTMRSGSVSVDYVNSYLYFIVVSGVIGLIIFSFYIIGPILSLMKVRNIASPQQIEVLAALFSAQISLCVMVFSTSFFERVPLFSMLFVALTKRAIADIAEKPKNIVEKTQHSYITGVRIVDPMHPTIGFKLNQRIELDQRS